MKYLCFVAFLTGFSVLQKVVESIEYYKTRYDHLDIEAILNNRRMVNYYAACMLNRGPCPPEGLEFKHILPEALQTNCEKCTEKQKTVILRSVKRLKKEYPKVWTQLAAQWDPDGSYTEKFEKTFSNYYYPLSLGVATSSTTLAAVPLFNRFGDNDDSSNNIVNNVVSTKKTTTTTTKPPISTTKQSLKPYSNPVVISSSTTTTNKPITTNTNRPVTQATPTKSRPTATVAVNTESLVKSINSLKYFVSEKMNFILKIIGFGR